MQHHNLLIHQSFETLKDNNIKVYSVKTDALTLKASDIEKAKQLLHFDPGMGNWRISKEKNIMYPGRCLQLKQNVIPIKPLIINHLNIPDEFDTPAIAKQLIDNKHVCIFGDVPGVGKSHACKYLVIMFC